MRSSLIGGAMAWLAGCGGTGPPELLDTGWFDDATTGTGCQDRFVAFEPEHGAVDWYWHDRPTAFTSSARPDRYRSWLVDDAAREIPTSLLWGEANLSFALTWDGWLAPETEYSWFLQDCLETREIRFTTSDLGQTLVGGPEALVGNVYVVDLAEADWVEPPTLGALVGLYLNDPILLEVAVADATQLRLLGAPSTGGSGALSQDRTVPTWDFGFSDFTGQPFFDAQSERIVLQYRVDNSVIDIPVQDFLLQGTFSADGSLIGGGVLSGRADTRGIGAALARDNPARLCDLAATQGVECVACTDSEVLCLDVVGRNVTGTLAPSLDLVPVTAQ